MPSRSRGTPSPLAGLPRPLSERDKRGPRARRALTIGIAGSILGVAGFVVATSSWSPGPFAPAGAVAGAAGVQPSASAAPSAAGQRASGAPSPAPAAGSDRTPAPTGPPTPPAAPTPPPVAALTGYQWPLPHGRLTLPFGPTPWGSRVVDGELFHDGMDLATFCGDRVVAAHDGVVLAAGRHYDREMGWVGDLQPYLDRLEKKQLYSTLPIVLVVDDGNGYRSIYAHFSKVVVKKGDTIRAGQLIGYEGRTGRASGCHVHFGLFSPLETATFAMDPTVAKRMKLPSAEIARVDPLLVLPERPKPTKAPTPTPTITPPP